MQHIDRFVYDSVGNRYTEVSQNEQERVVAFGEGRFYHFDPAGQLTKRSHDKQPTQKLQWNAWGKLIGVDDHTTYTYDALGRRIGKVCHQNGKTKTSCFIWNINALAAEVEQEKTAQQATFIGYYPWSFVPLTLQTKAQESDNIIETGYYFYQNEFNGAPIRLRNETGEIVWAAHYNALGQAKIIKDATVRQPLRLQGQYFDDETGLHYNRHRYYDPAVGLFISQDPIGLLGGINVYQFAPNTIHWVDPLGLNNVSTGEGRTHITYDGIRNGNHYTGYASMPGLGHSQDEVLDYRYSGGFDVSNPDVPDVRPKVIYHGEDIEGKNTARGLEQSKFEDNVNEYRRENVDNKQNPIGENNGKKDTYREAAEKEGAKNKGGGGHS